MFTENVFYRWSKSNFPPESVGEHLVPDFIEGRDRPQATIALPLQRLLGRTYLTRLSTLSVSNLRELLNIPRADFEASLLHPRYSESVKFKISKYLRDVAIGPEGLLLYWLFGTDPEQQHIKTPVSVGVEQARAETVKEVLQTLTSQEAKVIDLFFGITTGVRELRAEIEKEPGLPRSKTILEWARRKLRPFHAFGENMLGRTIFGVTCEYEFQQRLEDSNVAGITLADLTVSPDFKKVVRQQGVFGDSNRFMFDFLQLPVSAFSKEMLKELQQEFQAFLRQ